MAFQEPIMLEPMAQQPRQLGLEEDWTGLTSSAQRRRIQNRLNQRAARTRKKKEKRDHVDRLKLPPPAPRIQNYSDPSIRSASPETSETGSEELLPKSGVSALSIFYAAAERGTLDRYALRRIAAVCKLSAAEQQEAIGQIEKRMVHCLTMGSPTIDHVIVLVKFNVFRAMMSNSLDLGYSAGQGIDDDDALSHFSDPSNSVNIIPLPEALQPTELQRQISHHPWIDTIPISRMRDNLLKAGDTYDDEQLCSDLVGFCCKPSIRDGMILWGEPWDPNAWEMTESFVSIQHLKSSIMTAKYAAAHQSPAGPGDARPTALQIIKDEGLENKLTGKVVLITGCSSGIGIETARALYATGATLYLTARDLSKAKAELPDLVTSDRVHFLELDLNSFKSVRACAAEFLSKSKTLNIFIANAGVMACPEGRTEDGFETQIGVNHLSHFLLFNLLKQAILASASPEFNSRAIFLSSVGHRIAEPNFENLSLDGAYNDFIAYGQSKTAGIWTANEIDRRYGAKGLRAFSVHPGGIHSNLTRHLSKETVEAFSDDPSLEKVFKSPEQGAATTVWAATSKDLTGLGGKYLENCKVSRPWTEADGQWGEGTAAFAYDAEKEGKFWKMSLDLVGLKDDA
ncbi:Short-chain aldehyde dehydrogenase [Hyphodiscus hymeniophilus]|uniref:Short-chain aldehyde dehydrogenase n=1 Tax=Hyphodiscus hymeniophilus TaxID=353542 RepID=A0A9P7AVK7_9HELO|nr:Short-chain aldehyde dehydrogenase [Hyphodiscus hymeniophilus]